MGDGGVGAVLLLGVAVFATGGGALANVHTNGDVFEGLADEWRQADLGRKILVGC